MTVPNPARRPRAVAGTIGMLALAGSLLTAAPAAAAPPGCDDRTNNTVDKLLECVTLEGVTSHLQAFQAIADANDGNRASGTPGYDASADYVAAQAEAAGLVVSRQSFEFPFFQLNSSAFEQVAPVPQTYVADTDYVPMTYSGGGDVTAVAQAVDVVDPTGQPANTSTSGCEAGDFAGFTAGNIALMQRGTCSFGQKVANAEAAGAAAAIVYNEGQPGRDVLFTGTLGAPAGIPAVSTGYALGSSLDGATLRIAVDAVSEFRTTENVFAEVPGTSDDVVMVGAHLDSVSEGPGINDNGSGSAAILEVAKQMAKSKPEPTVRFAWWGAEELGLIGSTEYVATLPEAELARITSYLNFDMVGSPNYVRFIYDGDDSDGEGAGPGPEGSAEIEKVFEKFYADRGLAYEGTDFNGRSDYGPFIAVGIPAGGLFTGAEEIKTPEQAAVYGGTAGEPYDPCYHTACDTIVNYDEEVLDQNADAIAYATLTLVSGQTPGNGPKPRPDAAVQSAVAGHDHDASS
ncbi:MAG TPA: M28 family peptidase [Pseudonocardia sp.]|nr:M28 family peptidase [Pseudonocardia sp.]